MDCRHFPLRHRQVRMIRLHSHHNIQSIVLPPRKVTKPYPLRCSHPKSPSRPHNFLRDPMVAQIKVRKNEVGTRSWNKAVNGRDKRHHRKLKLGNGIDTGLRHCKKLLANELLRLEQLTEQEERWDMRFSETSFNHEFSARTTLGMYWREFSEGKYTILEDDSQRFMRYRGRQQQIATNSDYPTEQDESKCNLPKSCPDPSTGILYTKAEITISGGDGHTSAADRLTSEA